MQNDEEPNHMSSVYELHEGLDSTTFSLEDIFEERFPSLIRASAFISIYSSIEIEIQKLCEILQKKEQYKLL